MLIIADTKIAGICSFRFDDSKKLGSSEHPYKEPNGCRQDGITFQFPPLLDGDSRSGTWEEKELPADMSLSVYKTSAARKWTLTWTYIIGESGSDGSVWTAEQIKYNCSNLRAYYTQSYAGTGGKNFIVYFMYGYHGNPGGEFTCRLSTIDISHKGPMMAPDGNWANAFRLRTDVKVGMQLWTKGAQALGSTKDVKTLVPGLKKGMSADPKWE